MTTNPLPQNSTHSWAGLTSQKFHGGIKTDYPNKNELIGFTGKDLPVHGRRHFTPKSGKDFPTNVGIRTYEYHNQPGKIEEQKSKRNVIKHERQEKIRKERMHLRENQTGHQEDLPYGIKTYEHANSKSSTHYCNFELMGAHRLINEFQQQRNDIPCKSMGDKAYRTPDYSNGFFSKAQVKLEKEFIPMKIQEEKKWEFKVKLQERQEDLDAVDELEKWEERMEIQKKEPEEEKQQAVKGKLPPPKKK